MNHANSNTSAPFLRRFPQAVRKGWNELNAMFARTTGYGGGQLLKSQAFQQLQEYRGWIYIAVSAINNRFESIPFNVIRIDTGEVITPDDPAFDTIMRPFIRPNQYMSFRRLKSFMQLEYDLMGKAFAQIIPNAMGKPAGLWPLRTADFVKIHRGDTTTDYIRGFEFRERMYKEDEIVYFHHIDPRDPFLSMSPVQAMAYESDIDRYIAIYERDFFKKGAVPDIILSTDKKLGKEHVEGLQERWSELYGGETNFHGVAVVDGGLSPTILNPSTKDLAFLELAKWTQDKILAAYQVPAGKVGLVKDVNKANAFGIDVTFNSECIRPRLMDFDEEMSRSVLWQFDERLLMKHENPVPRDREFELEEVVRGVPSGLFTVNEARRRYHGGVGIGTGGDAVYINIAQEPIGQTPALPESDDISLQGTPSSTGDDPQAVDVDTQGTGFIEAGMSSGDSKFIEAGMPDPTTEQGRDAMYKHFERTVRRKSEAFYPMLDRFFTEQRSEVIRALKKYGPDLVKFQSEQDYAKRMIIANWNSIISDERNLIFVDKDLEAIATANGAIDQSLLKEVTKWMEQKVSMSKALEFISTYYSLKADSVISKILFDLEEETEDFAKELAPIERMVFRSAAEEAIVDASHRYITQA